MTQDQRIRPVEDKCGPRKAAGRCLLSRSLVTVPSCLGGSHSQTKETQATKIGMQE